MKRKLKQSKRAAVARKYPKSNKVGRSCFGKTIYPSLDEAEKGATIMWGKDSTVDRADLEGYECKDGCRGFHIGHKSYHREYLKRNLEQREQALPNL